MPHALVFVAADRPAYFEAVRMLGRVALARKLGPPNVLAGWTAAEWIYNEIDSELRAEAHETAIGLAVDWALIPTAHRRKKLLIADMDSTIIGCECLDELADYAGRKAEISAITERAMRGELEFEAALAARVAMLKGLDLAALQACFDARVRLNPGARALVRTMRAHGAHTMLVSGGFDFFTARVADMAGFDAHRANSLVDDGARLTGDVREPILGRAAKLHALETQTRAMGFVSAETLAIGDGANDLDMIAAAGLGLAYRAKPIVAEAADARIDQTNLETALYFQGYRRADFVAD